MSKRVHELHPINRRSLMKRVKFRFTDIQGAEYVEANTDTAYENGWALVATYHGGYAENPLSLILQEGALKRFELQVALFLIEHPETHIEIMLGSATEKTAKRRPITKERILDDLVMLTAIISNELPQDQYGRKDVVLLFARLLLTKSELQRLALQRKRNKNKFNNGGRF